MLRILEQVAKKNGVSVEEVSREIDKAIEAAMVHATKDPDAAARWNIMFPDGKKPTAEQFIRRMAADIKYK